MNRYDRQHNRMHAIAKMSNQNTSSLQACIRLLRSHINFQVLVISLYQLADLMSQPTEPDYAYDAYIQY